MLHHNGNTVSTTNKADDNCQFPKRQGRDKRSQGQFNKQIDLPNRWKSLSIIIILAPTRKWF